MKPEEVTALRAARAELRSEYGDLFDATSAILFRHDPVGINFESNTDEYELRYDAIAAEIWTLWNQSGCR